MYKKDSVYCTKSSTGDKPQGGNPRASQLILYSEYETTLLKDRKASNWL
jgi:hypothetical protein